MGKLKHLTLLFLLIMLFVVAGHPSPAALASHDAVAPDLGSAASFVALASSTLTNTGSGVFVGNVGVSPGTEVIGFPPGTLISGMIYAGGAVPTQAQIDANSAYVDLANQVCNVDLTGQDLGGMTLTPNVYCFDTSAQLTGDLVLDALGDPLAVWVFQMGSTLTTASTSSVAVSNGGQALNVFWQVGSSAILGTGTMFKGNILADASITLDTGASLIGRALALNGAVTMDTNGTPFPISNTPLFRFVYLPFIIQS
jgi:type VI secretion system secreted protein VgrG